jgi:hypothetical protein
MLLSFKRFFNVSCLFRFPRNTKGYYKLILGHYPKLKLSWNAKIEIVNFCGKWQLFSYKFDQIWIWINSSFTFKWVISFQHIHTLMHFISDCAQANAPDKWQCYKFWNLKYFLFLLFGDDSSLFPNFKI